MLLCQPALGWLVVGEVRFVCMSEALAYSWAHSVSHFFFSMIFFRSFDEECLFSLDGAFDTIRLHCSWTACRRMGANG